jgi:hypothetical protein
MLRNDLVGVIIHHNTPDGGHVAFVQLLLFTGVEIPAAKMAVISC